MSEKYILNENGDPVVEPDLLKWADWFESGDRSRIVVDHIGGAVVSTVFLGLDHAFSGGPPVLFETLVFGGHLDGEMERYHTRAEALAGHAEMVKRVRASLQ